MVDKTVRYLNARIDQVLEEAGKCSQEEDSKWFKKIAQELDWVRQYHTGEFSTECVMAGVNDIEGDNND